MLALVVDDHVVMVILFLFCVLPFRSEEHVESPMRALLIADRVWMWTVAIYPCDDDMITGRTNAWLLAVVMRFVVTGRLASA